MRRNSARSSRRDFSSSRCSRYGGEAGVERREIGDALPDHGQRGQRRGFAVVECGVRLGGEPAETVGVRQHVPLGAEGLVFAVARRHLVDLLQLKRGHVDARPLLAIVEPRAIERGDRGAPVIEPRADFSDQRVVAGKAVEQRDVLVRIEQRLMLVLPVQLDQSAAKLAERGRGRERVVDERAAAALRRDLAAHDDFVAAVPLEDGLYGRGLFAGAHEVGARASADEQVDGFDEDRLSRAGFAGEDVEPRLELHLERFDHCEMANAQEAQHA